MGIEEVQEQDEDMEGDYDGNDVSILVLSKDLKFLLSDRKINLNLK